MPAQAAKWIAAAAILPIGLTGCMVGPDYKAPTQAMPGKFAAAVASTQPAGEASGPMVSLERWWESFNDPELDSLINRAVRANIDLRVAESRVREARSQLQIQRAAIYPNVNSDASYNRQRFTKTGFFIPTGAGGTPRTLSGTNGTVGTTGTLNRTPAIRRDAAGGASNSSGLASAFSKTEIDTFQGGFDASWELDVFGGVRRNVEAAGADEQASIESRRDTLVSLLAEVARNYIDVRGVQRELQIADENIKSQTDTLELTRSRFKAGLATDLDVARAEAQLATTRATVPGSETALQQGIHRISVMLDQDPADLEKELTRVAPIPLPPPNVPVGIPSQLLRRRPDIRRAERQLAAANARIGAATADLFPRFSLTGSLGLASGSFHNIGRLDSAYYSIGPSVSWPIFDAGRIRANIDVQSERQVQAAGNYEAAVLDSLEDVENALVGYGQEQARHRDLQVAAEANRRAVQLATQLYEKGLTDFLTVLDAQRNLFAAEDNLVQSDRALSNDIVALYKALGGGWESFESQQQEPGGRPDVMTTAAH